jgi:hypothetical protein
MGDVQEYFIKKNVGTFIRFQYQGYPSEAGANPITVISHFQTGSLWNTI